MSTIILLEQLPQTLQWLQVELKATNQTIRPNRNIFRFWLGEVRRSPTMIVDIYDEWLLCLMFTPPSKKKC